ncbi:RNA helicase [Mycena sanguinolenta]|uniref:RNA helicase n=1 Tax=Mycena sanguinolenta TaxID=230812 RepID=A0A8H7CE43_9AGAR|nr:RNA helicase [Mycena sanguinolenta]
MAANAHSMTASLPSDYAVVSQYAAAHPNGVEPSTEGGAENEYRISKRPSRPSMAVSPVSQLPQLTINPTERTPLLNAEPPVPRIDEGHPEDGELSTAAMYLSEFWILAKYSLPVFGTHLLEYSLIMAPVLSIGHLSSGTTALAGITLGSMTASVSGFSILQGFVSALDTLLPPAWTSSQPNLVGLWSQRMGVVMGASLIPMYFIWFNAEAILLGLKQDPEVAKLAAIYLKWVSLGLPAYAFNLVSRHVALNHCGSRKFILHPGLFAVPTRIITVVAPINALLNYLLVWGPEPFRLGFIGAPIATACAFNLVCLLNICYGVFFCPPNSMASLLAPQLHQPRRLTAPRAFRSRSNGVGVVGLGIGRVGRIFVSQPLFGSGNLLGEFNPARAKVAANTSILMALGLATVFSGMFMCFRNSWAYLFNDDALVVELVAGILPLVALFQVFDGTSAVTGGILRAKGKQMTGALLNLSAYYIIGIPFGAFLGFNLKLGLHGLWIGLTVSLVYCAVFGTILCVRTDWDREVRKVVARINEERRQDV